MDVNKGAISYFEEFLDKISPLRTANKLGAILFQLPPSNKEMNGMSLSTDGKKVLERAQTRV